MSQVFAETTIEIDDVKMDISDDEILDAAQRRSQSVENLSIEDELNILKRRTVHKGTTAEKLCKQLIRVVVCTFGSPMQYVIINAMLTYDERQAPTRSPKPP